MICGIPNFLIRTYNESGPWPYFFGKRYGSGVAKRLTLDHIVPGCNEGGFRPLCSLCNSKRGAAQYTDAEVLRWVSKRWKEFISLRYLWWLNTSPGEGGRLHRSEACTKRDALFANEVSIKDTNQPLPMNIHSSSNDPSVGSAG